MKKKKPLSRSRIIAITGLTTFALATAGCPTTSNPPPVDTGDTAESSDTGDSAINES